MTIENDEQLSALSRIGAIVARTLRTMMAAAEPGMTTAELDAVGRDALAREGARSAPILCYGFPGTTCISINNEAAHGIPGERRLGAGDLVNVDVSAELDGYFGDTGASFQLAPTDGPGQTLLAAAEWARAAGIHAARPGAKISDIGRAIEAEALAAGFTPVRNLGSHGIGRALHEAPRFIPGYYREDETRTLSAGQVITVEPFLSTDRDFVMKAADGWTLQGPSHNRFAQFEHTIVVSDDGPIILTAP